MEFGPIFRALTRHRARSILIVAEVALTLAIVANCISLIGNAKAAMARESGFDDDNLLSIRSRPFAPAFQQQEYVNGVIDDDVRRLRSISGVRDASNTFFLPWQGGGSSGEVKIAGGADTRFRTQMYRADPHLFDTLGIHVVRGRNFTPQENESATFQDITSNVIVTQALSDLLFPGGSALGKQLR